jgi:hypothetical protein
LNAEDVELAALYRIRWSQLTGLVEASDLSPSANDWRIYYSFRLRYPEGDSFRERLLVQLSYVDGLRKYDVDYPASYARGILQYRLGAYDAALDSFGLHLAAHPFGAFTLRARNGAAAATAALLSGS